MRTPSAEELRTVADLRIALRRFHAATEKITSRHGLTPRQYDLLAILHALPDGSTPTELARSLQLTRNATTELITRAEDKGLVDRFQSDGDRRRKRVRPTQLGTRLFFGALSDLAPERQRLFGILEEIVRHATGLAERSAANVEASHRAGRRARGTARPPSRVARET